jgi:hypothetical protein
LGDGQRRSDQKGGGSQGKSAFHKDPSRRTLPGLLTNNTAAAAVSKMFPTNQQAFARAGAFPAAALCA